MMNELNAIEVLACIGEGVYEIPRIRNEYENILKQGGTRNENIDSRR